MMATAVRAETLSDRSFIIARREDRICARVTSHQSSITIQEMWIRFFVTHGRAADAALVRAAPPKNVSGLGTNEAHGEWRLPPSIRFVLVVRWSDDIESYS
jgi:hypothetical protein